MKKLRTVIIAILAILLLSWPALINGQAFVFSDSTNYLRAGGAAWKEVFKTGLGSDWAEPVKGAPAAASSVATSGTEESPAPVLGNESLPLNDPEAGLVMAGRSPYLGIAAFLSSAFGEFWPWVFGLGLINYYLITLTLRVVGVEDSRPRLLSAAVIGLVTPAAFYNSTMLADAFCAQGVVGLALWLLASSRLRTIDKVILAALTVFSAMAHLTHILVYFGMLFAFLVFRLCTRGPWRPAIPGILMGLASIVIGLVSVKITSVMIEKTYGNPPVQLPMLTARFCDDGPGARYLKEHPEDTSFLVSRFRDRLPMSSQLFLWNPTPGESVYLSLNQEERLRMCSEDKAFAIKVFCTYPIQQSLAILSNAFKQAGNLDMHIFNYSDAHIEHFRKRLPTEDFQRLETTRAYRSGWAMERFTLLHYVTAILSLATLCFCWFRQDDKISLDDRQLLRGLFLLFVAAILANGLICGAASEPQGRYGARLAWIITLAPLVWLARSRFPIQSRSATKEQEPMLSS